MAVLTGEQAATLSRPLPQAMDPAAMGGEAVEVRCLALGEVLFAGQPVAAVAARTEVEARRALELIEVEYEPLPAVLTAREALAPGAPTAYAGASGNVVMRRDFVEGDTETALAGARHRVQGSIEIQRTTTTPIETRGYMAAWDALQQALTLVGTTQNPHPERWILATTLGLAEEQVRVVAPNLGGAFGAKMRAQPESVIVSLLARLTSGQVKWVEDRTETFLQGAREQTQEFEAGFAEDGRLLALRVRGVADVGIVSASPGWGMSFLTALTFPTGYVVPNLDVRMTAVATNKAPWLAARGFGKEATNLVMERVMDLGARAAGIDPADIRRRNLVPADRFPYRTATGLNLDSGDYAAAVDDVLAAAHYEDARAEQAAARREGRLFGIGIAFELTPESADIPGTITGGFDTSTVRVGPSGGVTVLTGVTSPGGGSDTAIVQVVADRLGVDPSTVTLVQGDTDRCPFGFGNSSGRGTLVGASSAALAADDVRAKLQAVGARLLDADPAAVWSENGSVRAPGGGAVSFAEVAKAVYTRAFEVAREVEPPLESTRAYRPGNIDHQPDERGRIQPYPTYSYAVHVAVVEVDAETGLVRPLRHAVAHDCGTMINPALVEGQMLGAVSMGHGIALAEQLVHDGQGRLLTDRFKTYLLRRASDMPPVTIVHRVTPSPFTLLGTKGAGEAGVGGAQAAVVNAVDDALQAIGASVTHLPLNPPTVLAAIRAAAR